MQSSKSKDVDVKLNKFEYPNLKIEKKRIENSDLKMRKFELKNWKAEM